VVLRKNRIETGIQLKGELIINGPRK